MAEDGYLEPGTEKRGRPPKEREDGVPADLRDWREAWDEYSGSFSDDAPPDEGDEDDYEELLGDG